jgi:hypothetical protein
MRKPPPAMIVALAALFVALGGVGVASTGGNFILGQSNSADSKTSLTAGINDKALAITNTNTGSNAGALALSVAPGKPPLVVSAGAGKVQSLNADKLDGTDSNGFVRGTNARIVSAHITTPIDPALPQITIVTVPSFGTLLIQCPDFFGVYVGFRHTSSNWMAVEMHNGTDPVVIENTGSFTQLQTGEPDSDHWTVAIGKGSGSSALIATLDYYTNYDATNGCAVQAQAVLSQGA